MTKQEVIQKVRETKILPLTNDLIFKKIFPKDECNSELKDLLEGILEIKIQKVEVKNPELPKNILGEKLARLDIKAKINDEITLDIEMQTRDEYNLGNRSLVYLSKLISPQLMPGGEYKYLKKTTVYMVIISLISVFGVIMSLFAMPSIFWGVQLSDLFYITGNKGDLANKFTELMANLNLTERSLYDWANRNLTICIVIMDILLIVTIVILVKASNHFKKGEK